MAVYFLVGNSEWQDIIQLRRQIRDMLIDYWHTYSLFSINWWLLLTSTIIFFIIWVIILDKRRIIEIASFGLIIGTTTFIMDIIGNSLVLWSYPDRIIPMITPILEIHHAQLPIIYMIVYQYFSTWKSFFIALSTTSFVFSFMLEPLTMWLGIYEIYHWKYIYSFPIYILIGCVFRLILLKVKQIEKAE
ncbi:CBO0543 family protein [Ornithinibacillus xuwenensis]|uniref:CBO0543 family protein n=1 Tax=Ornithinibacillus xuwenensis TaxID=3144668 RepID=A0ABU9XJM1_9BACI